MSVKDQFQALCDEIELELIYRLGIDEGDMKLIDEYFRLKYETQFSGGISYKHNIKKLESIKECIINQL